MVAAVLACAGAVLCAAAPPEPSPRYLTIVVERAVPPGAPLESTEYIQADRRREEFSSGFGSDTVFVTRCDRRQEIILGKTRRTYSIADLSRDRGMAALQANQTGGPALPAVRIDVTTVDTGERQERHGYPARRVITTYKRFPVKDAQLLGAEITVDGWFIDLEFRSLCQRPTPPAPWGPGEEVTLNMGPVGTPIGVPTVTYVGARETGFPVELARDARLQVVGPNDAVAEQRSLWTMRVTSLSTSPHDPALFEIPPHFRSWPDAYGPSPSLWNRVLNNWYWLEGLIFGPADALARAPARRRASDRA